MKGIVSVSIMVGVLGCGGAAYAQQPAPRVAASVADGIDGLPGLYRLPIIAEAAPRLGAGMWLNYGYTEPQNDVTGAHHRLGGTGSVGGTFVKYVELGLRFDVRHDIHPKDDEGSDSGTVVDFTPLLRAGVPLGDFRLGAEGRFLLSGAGQENVPGPTPEGRLILNYVKDGYWVSGFGGYRTPNFGHDDIDAEQLRAGDRVTLGVSEFPMITTGLGVMKDFAPLSVIAELSWDIAIGDGAPSAWKSPLRVGLGARRSLMHGLNLQGMVEVSPGARAPSTVSDPLVPIEPRVAVIFGLTVRLPDLVVKPKTEQPRVVPTKSVEERPAIVEPPPPPPPKARLRVEIVDEGGHPISDAKVKLWHGDRATGVATGIDVPLEELNRYAAIELEPGIAELSVEAELLQSYSQEVHLEADQDNVVVVKLRKAIGKEGQLRGLVRSFVGQGVAAKVRVEPGNLEVSCNEQGEFELDLPPGTYSVIIEAEGYLAQRRPVRIRKDGVTVLNADLQRSN